MTVQAIDFIELFYYWCGLGNRQFDGESGTRARLAFDQQAAAVVREDMLDDGQAKRKIFFIWLF